MAGPTKKTAPTQARTAGAPPYTGTERRSGIQRRQDLTPFSGTEQRVAKADRRGRNLTTAKAMPALTDEEKADQEKARQEDFDARQKEISDERADIASKLANADITNDEKVELDARSTELDRAQSKLDKERALPPGTVPDTLASLRRRLIFDLEKQAQKGHGLQQDRELMAEAAQHLRHMLGYTPTEPMLGPNAPYGPVVNELPIGHSLPVDWPEDAGDGPVPGQVGNPGQPVRPVGTTADRMDRPGVARNRAGAEQTAADLAAGRTTGPATAAPPVQR